MDDHPDGGPSEEVSSQSVTEMSGGSVFDQFFDLRNSVIEVTILSPLILIFIIPSLGCTDTSTSSRHGNTGHVGAGGGRGPPLLRADRSKQESS